MSKAVWKLRLSAAAQADFRQILRWTARNFGPAQAKQYADTLSLALKALGAGPTIPGVKDRPEIGKGIKTLHVARNGRQGSHFILLRIAAGPQEATIIEVLRVLHERMDLEQHLPTNAHEATKAYG